MYEARKNPAIALVVATAAAFSLVLGAYASNGDRGYARSVTPGLVDAYSARFSPGVPYRLKGWHTFVVNAGERRPSDELALLGRVNDFVNVQPYVSDIAHWRTEDYWATPAEFYGSNGGDCEDYAIAKFFALKELGVPTEKLRLVYTMAWQGRRAQPHMVLAYYATPDATPLILDNDIRGEVVPATQRPDLVPVYSFNDDETALRFRRENPGQSRRWKDLVDKLDWELRS